MRSDETIRHVRIESLFCTFPFSQPEVLCPAGNHCHHEPQQIDFRLPSEDAQRSRTFASSVTMSDHGGTYSSNCVKASEKAKTWRGSHANRLDMNVMPFNIAVRAQLQKENSDGSRATTQ